MLPNADAIKERTARQKSWDYAKTMAAIEGGVITEEDELLAKNYVKGAVSLWQYGQKMDALLKAMPAIKPTPENMARMEGRFVTRRLLELREYPLKGVFNSNYLKAIHRYLFQDMAKLGEEFAREYAPGEFREPVGEGHLWLKTIHIERVNRDFHVAYSNMAPKLIADIDGHLSGLNFHQLYKLSADEFARKLGMIYILMDFARPFKIGNGYALREFTSALALKANFVLDWGAFAGMRDILRVAMLLSVNSVALPRVNDPVVREALIKSCSALRKNQQLPEILAQAVTKLEREKLSFGNPTGDPFSLR